MWMRMFVLGYWSLVHALISSCDEDVSASGLYGNVFKWRISRDLLVVWKKKNGGHTVLHGQVVVYVLSLTTVPRKPRSSTTEVLELRTKSSELYERLFMFTNQSHRALSSAVPSEDPS
jgi:hypothetical protein